MSDRRRYLLYNLLFLILALFIICCEAPQPVEIEGPEDIKPIIRLTKTVSNNIDTVKYLIKVTLKDRNNHNIYSLNCDIYVNNSPMSPPNWSVFGYKRYYYKSTIPVLPDSLYTFRFIFDDGSIYKAWVRTPAVDLKQINMPEKQQRNNPLTITWQEKDYQYPQKLLIQYWDIDDGYSSNNQETFIIDYPYLGEYTINKKYIKYTDADTSRLAEMRIYLVSETFGVLDLNFLDGGSITSQLKVYKDIEIY